MLLPINDVGRIGLVKDIPAHIAPFNAWSDLKNVRLVDRAVMKGSGYTQERAASVDPYFILNVQAPTKSYHVYAGLAKVYAFLESSEGEITSAAGNYTGSAIDYWSGGMFNGIPFLNNGVEYPQVWDPISLSQKLVNLPNWPVNTTAKVVRAYKNYLVALSITKSGGTDPRMVKWSHAAVPGYVPSSWDETDATVDAGEVSLAEGSDTLVDCMPLGGTNIIYGSNSTWAMSYIGHPFIFSFRKLFGSSGIIALDAVEYFKNLHFAVTLNDIIVHNGTTIQSVVGDITRRWFFSNLNSGYVHTIRTVKHLANREIWVLFPYQASTIPNMALIWNWEEGTWSVQDLPNVQGITSVPYEVTEDGSWAAYVGAWSAATGLWGSGPMTPKFLGTIMLGNLASKSLDYIDNSGQEGGLAFTSYVERKGLDVDRTIDGQLYHNPRTEKLLTAIWPQIESVDGTVFKIYAGSHSTPGGVVTWSVPKDWTVGQSPKVDITAQGRYLATKIVHEGSEVDWKLTGYLLDVEQLGGL